VKTNYFHTINTKEKAYWLGFLYADGCICKQPGTIRIQLKLKRSDEETIDRFCEALRLDKNKKDYRHEKQEDGRISEKIRIRFARMETGNDLLRHGLKFRKSKIIEYPKLTRRCLELAFLLGYYDGDGLQKTTRIHSGSIKFLKQVKKRFHLPYKIHTNEQESTIYSRKIKGTEYYMDLGTKLFSEIMKNYKNSMPRKRWYPLTQKEKLHRQRIANSHEAIMKRRELQKDWRAITKEELEKLVQQMPLTQIGTKLNVSGKGTVSQKCKKLGISILKHGYWQKRYHENRRATQNTLNQNQQTTT
jgi:hypothetical protein